MLAHLHGVQARVVDVPVRPIYGPTWKSGVRWHTAVYPVGFVLCKSWWKRLQNQKRKAESAAAPPPLAITLPSESEARSVVASR